MTTTTDLVHQGTASLNEGSSTGFAGLYADDAVLSTPDGQFQGPAAIADYVSGFLTASPGSRTELGRSAASGDVYFGEFTVRGTNTGPTVLPDGHELPATGRTWVLTGVEVATATDGRIVQHDMYWDSVRLLGQLGLLPA